MEAENETRLGVMPDGYDWHCLRCENTYPEDFEPIYCPACNGPLSRTMARLKLGGESS